MLPQARVPGLSRKARPASSSAVIIASPTISRTTSSSSPDIGHEASGAVGSRCRCHRSVGTGDRAAEPCREGDPLPERRSGTWTVTWQKSLEESNLPPRFPPPKKSTPPTRSWTKMVVVAESEALPAGGSNRGAVVLGDGTVRRPVRENSDAVQRLLRHVRGTGFTAVPEPYGFDDEGREHVSFIAGEVPRPPLPTWAATTDTLCSIGELLTGFREASATFCPPPHGTLVCKPRNSRRVRHSRPSRPQRHRLRQHHLQGSCADRTH